MATNQLSSLLVQDRIVTPQQVEEAFQRQVLFGGRIGTNLLEIGALEEKIFLVYLSRITGLPWAGRDMLTSVDWEATELLDVETVRAEKLLPVRFDGQTVRALVADPLSVERLRAIREHIGHPINQYVTSEFRFAALLQQLYDVPLSNRFRLLGDRFPVERAPEAPGEPETVDEPWALHSAEIELDDELLDDSSSPGLRIANKRESKPVAVMRPVMLGEAQQARVSRPITVEPEPLDDDAAAIAPRVPAASLQVAEPTGLRRANDLGRPDTEPLRPTDEPMTATLAGGSFGAEAHFRNVAEESDDRDQVLEAFAQMATEQFTDNCLLFVLARGQMRGHVGDSRQVGRLNMRGLEVDVSDEPDLHRVLSGASYYQGPILESVTLAYGALGARAPERVMVLPVKMLKRPVMLAVVDEPSEAELPRVFEAVFALGSSLERIFVAHKARASGEGVAVPSASGSASASSPGPDVRATIPSAPPVRPLATLGDEIPVVDVQPMEDDAFRRPRTLNEMVELEALDDFDDGLSSSGIASPRGLDPAALEAGDRTDFPLHRGQRDRADTLGAHAGRPIVGDDDEVDLGFVEVEPLREDDPLFRDLSDSQLEVEVKKGGFASVPHSSVFLPKDPALDDSDGFEIIDNVEALPEGSVGYAPKPLPSADEFDYWAGQLDARERDVARRAMEFMSQRAPAAVAALMKRFPGRLRLDRFHYARDTPPPQRHSRVLGALVAQGELAGPGLMGMLRSTSADERFYALLTLAELRETDVLERVSQLVFDKDPQVRNLAIRMVRRTRDPDAFDDFVTEVADVLEVEDTDPRSLELALRALGQMRNIACLPFVLPFLEHDVRRVADAAREACVALSLDDAGSQIRKWGRILDEDEDVDRVQRIGDAMVHKDRRVRELAADELAEFPGMMLNYHPDAHRRERARARMTFLEWVERNPEQAHQSLISSGGFGMTSHGLRRTPRSDDE